jgi:hypothetical protein
MVDIFIKNKRTYNGEGEYVGRPSPLGNPFRITFTQPRQVAIERYAFWLVNIIDNQDEKSIKLVYPKVIPELNRLFNILIDKQKLILICHCSPKPCHANVIKQILLDKYHTGSFLI